MDSVDIELKQKMHRWDEKTYALRKSSFLWSFTDTKHRVLRIP